MTFCIALKTSTGLVALADTQIVRGSEQLTKGKIGHLGGPDNRIFVMSSGLRSVRDKLVIYVDEALEALPEPPTRLYQVVNLFGEQLRRIRAEDAEALAAGKLSFNAHAIIGGRLAGDTEPTLFYLYPEGNWIEVSPDSPWFMIGRTYYGLPILDRLMHHDVSLTRAAALALLAFDATQQSVTDVDFPVDMLSLGLDPLAQVQAHRFEQHELSDTLAWWQRELAGALERMPTGWTEALFDTPDGHPRP